ncbi:hypothetical protein PIB30_037746 [Stylosanthes scabra]|uniref:Uncharacterized protein n=1 Tax=Stylosanthes scabra TaxID=79078 RepID=A0ABU6TDH5_9FABA|nr:hypothetical protein [Stylosanthes scabra]
MTREGRIYYAKSVVFDECLFPYSSLFSGAVQSNHAGTRTITTNTQHQAIIPITESKSLTSAAESSLPDQQSPSPTSPPSHSNIKTSSSSDASSSATGVRDKKHMEPIPISGIEIVLPTTTSATPNSTA